MIAPWAEQEMTTAHFGDARLDARVTILLSAEDVEASIRRESSGMARSHPAQTRMDILPGPGVPRLLQFKNLFKASLEFFVRLVACVLRPYAEAPLLTA